MTPETALGEISRGLQMALTLGGPALIAVLVVGVAVGVLQAATQVDGPTIQFVVKALGLVVVRLGLTPSRLGYKPQKLVEALAKVRMLE